MPLMVGYLRVEVTDTGAGIAMENQENVFGEFSQFNRNKLQGGGICQVLTLKASDHFGD